MVLTVIVLALAARALAAPDIHWSFGPATLSIASVASIPLQKGFISIQDGELRRFLEASGNPPTGREVAVAGPTDLHWFAVISRENRISVDELHRAIVDGTAAANLIRARQGRETLDVLGYREKPRFDDRHQVLTWSLDTVESGGRAVVNRFAYFVGRDSVIAFEMVTEEAEYPRAQAEFDRWLGGFRFLPGREVGTSVDWRLLLVLAIAAGSAWFVLGRRGEKAT
ncbi:DUF2167 domain-containing protein [uncultured Paludibaculum sp.]|uniref:DUF2167 domain-containing protein n=1 Tax=uncultured Paludibaculum sp. TaxID=1765020 RepID=UPI002AAAE4AE|nr:DUF2167 domain-containing protein [uncultured Paludibaculum sp.]